VQENTLYHDRYVQITPSIARFGDTSYQIANIGSVRIVAGRKFRPGFVLLFIAGIAMSIYAMLADEDARAVGIAGVCLVLMAAVLQAILPKKEYTVVLKTSSGDVEALHSLKRNYVSQVKAAIEDAFMVRKS
jgi:hypothetical protein